MNNKIGIYKITSPKGRIYIGQSRNIPRRIKSYSQDWFLKSNKQPRLRNSILKYGYCNHTFEVVEYCDLVDLNKRERYYQDKYNATSKSGLNCDLTESGKEVKVRSKETKNKLSKAHRGKVISNEVKEKISKSLKGRKLPFCVRFKISKGNKGKVFDKEFRDAVSIRMTGVLNHRSKVVLDTMTGVFYDTISEAAECYNVKPKKLSNMLNGWQKNTFPQLIKS